MNTLLLIGGGSKGSYEIGVWHALKKLNIDIDYVIGTEIGAINGMLLASDCFVKSYMLWTKKSFYKYFSKDKDYVDNHVISISNLCDYFYKHINKTKFNTSSINYGTFIKEDDKTVFIEKKNLLKKDIENIINNSYIDDYDLLMETCIKIGSDSIILVDLDSVGIKKKIKDKYKDLKITFITPDTNINNNLFYNSNNNKYNIKLGFNDTLKEFNRLDGSKYTFKYKQLDYNYKKYGDSFSYISKRIIGINNTKMINQLEEINTYKRLFKYNFNDKKTINTSLEYLGEVFDIPKYKIYDINMFNHILKTRFLNYDDDNTNVDMQHIKKLNSKDYNKKHVVNIIYNFMLEPVEHYKELNTLCLLFPKEFMGALYLYTIN